MPFDQKKFPAFTFSFIVVVVVAPFGELFTSHTHVFGFTRTPFYLHPFPSFCTESRRGTTHTISSLAHIPTTATITTIAKSTDPKNIANRNKCQVSFSHHKCRMQSSLFLGSQSSSISSDDPAKNSIFRFGEQILRNGSLSRHCTAFCKSKTRLIRGRLSASSVSSTVPIKERVLETLNKVREEAEQYVEVFDLTAPNVAFFALFLAIRKTPILLGLKGEPFVLRKKEIEKALELDKSTATTRPTVLLDGYFTMDHLQKALKDDFLDASRGSTDNRKGWQVTDVSQPRGDSFEEARMTYEDVVTALTKGTVIFNAAGAHIPQLAQPSLACTDATFLPCALNLYITQTGKRTSAPPHTDKQDVFVVQTAGKKHWKIFSVPDASIKPLSDIFARGKMEDSLPLHILEKTQNLLLETTLNPGDVLFCPAGFPHTTTTVVSDRINDHTPDGDNFNNEKEQTSVHLTMGIDHHIWELDYLSARRLALRRAGVIDSALGYEFDHDDNKRYIGKANQLPDSIRKDLFAELPLGLLDDDATTLIDDTAKELERISMVIDTVTASRVESSIWKETIERIRLQGKELLDVHRNMYLAAIDEGRTRDAEEAIASSLSIPSQPRMSQDRIHRLSLFRVKRFFDQIEISKNKLKEWSYSRRQVDDTHTIVESSAKTTIDPNWPFTMPLNAGDKVEAELGGAFFAATVSRISPDGTYDIAFFDGDQEKGVKRNRIKLLNLPPIAPTTTLANVDVSNMTPKQLKRWKKEQQKKRTFQN